MLLYSSHLLDLMVMLRLSCRLPSDGRTACEPGSSCVSTFLERHISQQFSNDLHVPKHNLGIFPWLRVKI